MPWRILTPDSFVVTACHGPGAATLAVVEVKVRIDTWVRRVSGRAIGVHAMGPSQSRGVIGPHARRECRRIAREVRCVPRRAAATSVTTSFRVRQAGGVLPLRRVGRKLAADIFPALIR